MIAPESTNVEKRQEYEARQKAICDYNQGIYEAEQRGEQKFAKFITTLNEKGEFELIPRVAQDKQLREELYKKYNIS